MIRLTAQAIDWHVKLRHALQTAAFAGAVALLQVAFAPHKPVLPPLVYSLFIGLTIWAVIDLGRHFLPASRETGWPGGWQGVLLVTGGIAAGWVVGNAAGDAVCRTFGLYGAGAVHASREEELRTGVLITLMAGVVGSYWFYARNKSAYLLRKMTEARRHADEARLKLLETQLEPHMLFNTLANLRALIGVDPARAQVMLDHMIAYLRSTHDASRASTHALQAEFERLRDYLELMKIRMGPRLDYALELPADLAGVRVPALLLQPLVENCIKHGLEPKVEGGRIDVRARRDAGRLLLEVVDTGVGDGGSGSGAPGFGLAQVRERLQALYADRASLAFERDARGARARITLPLAA